MRAVPFALLAVWLLAACVGSPAQTPTPAAAASPSAAILPIAREDTARILERLDGRPCPDSRFTCITLSVPLDHFDPTNRETLDVAFAVLPASGERRGTLVFATGGPGSSGIALADFYTDSLSARIREHYDIVFFDQRGVAQSGGLQCASAAAAFYGTDLQADTPAQEGAAIDAARRMAVDCVDEMKYPPTLPYLGTRQAVEDLEALRTALSDPHLWLYGESYGTQFAQTYAAAHPDRVAGLILDGTVDLTLTAPEYLRQQAQAFNDVLLMTLADCDAQPDCAADMGHDAMSVYDDLARRLADSPLPVEFPLPSGALAARTFSLADLETVAASYLYSESDRQLLLRGLAAAERGDLVPLTRMLYVALGLDPETLEAIPDPTYSDAVYYAVECLDYTFSPGAPEQRAQAYLLAGDPLDASDLRLSTVFYGDLPCAFWPDASTDADRPPPLRADGVPTLVLGATADPATPVSNGEAVYGRLADGYLVTVEGGPHVVYGRGDACVDDIVTAFVADGQMPAQRETTCEGYVSDAYMPLAPVDASEYGDVLDALWTADIEMQYLPEYAGWDGETTTAVGCPFGGTLEFHWSGERERYVLKDCSFSRGFALTGTGDYDADAGRFALDVQVGGQAEGRLAYVREADGPARVTGTYDGQVIDLSD